MDQKMKPTARQLEYQRLEFGIFIHFGLRTFYEGYVDFDQRPMSPSAFNPRLLNCDQWISTAKDAGMKYAVLTAKHHDGFSNWPSDYTTFSVKQSPWKNGEGDVVREFVDACARHGIKPGLYYSPYDGAADTYTKDPKAYDDYFINQITELLTNYGDIDILWFDGAGSEGHEYDWTRIVNQIRLLQPNILIFNIADPDFRWVGNEDGIAPDPCWNVVEALDFSILSNEQEALNRELWLPAECDVQIRANWFYNDDDLHTLKSLDELIGIYYYSVGRGANLLLNIGPDRRGLLPQPDTERVLVMRKEIRRRFARPLTRLTDFQRTEAGLVWQQHSAEPYLMNHVVLREDLTNGERIQSFKIKAVTAKTGKTVTIYEGRNIGNKAIIQVPDIKTRGIILDITKSDGEPDLMDIAAFYIN